MSGKAKKGIKASANAGKHAPRSVPEDIQLEKKRKEREGEPSLDAVDTLTTSPVTPRVLKREKLSSYLEQDKLESDGANQSRLLLTEGTLSAVKNRKGLKNKSGVKPLRITPGVLRKKFGAGKPKAAPQYNAADLSEILRIVESHPFKRHAGKGGPLDDQESHKYDNVYIRVRLNVAVISVPINRPSFCFLTIADRTNCITVCVNSKVLPNDADENFTYNQSHPSPITKPPVFMAVINGRIAFKPSTSPNKKFFITISDGTSFQTETPLKSHFSAFSSFAVIQKATLAEDIRNFAFPVLFGKLVQVEQEDTEIALVLEDPTGSIVIWLQDCIEFPVWGSQPEALMLAGAFNFEMVEIQDQKVPASTSFFRNVKIEVSDLVAYEEHWKHSR